MVAEYIEHEGFEVVDRIALEIPDNLEVGRRDPLALVDIYKRLNLDGVDALVLSSCVQMPSLAAIPIVERECGLPVISASVCTTYQMLQKLGLKTVAPNAGALLSGKY
jgi:maleate isomerase